MEERWFARARLLIQEMSLMNCLSKLRDRTLGHIIISQRSCNSHREDLEPASLFTS